MKLYNHIREVQEEKQRKEQEGMFTNGSLPIETQEYGERGKRCTHIRQEEDGLLRWASVGKQEKKERKIKTKTRGGEQEMMMKELKENKETKQTNTRGGETKMNSRKKSDLRGCMSTRIPNKGGTTIMKILLVLLMLIGGAGQVLAAGEDTVDLIITPAFNLSVAISSETNSFQGGADVTLGESRTLCVGTIVNDGNVTALWSKKTVATTAGAPTDWTLQTSGVVAKDSFRLLAVTTSTISQPDMTGGWAEIGDNGLIDGDHDASAGPCVTDAYTALTEGGSVSPQHIANVVTVSTRALWVSIMMPNDISEGTAQTITLSVQAATP